MFLLIAVSAQAQQFSMTRQQVEKLADAIYISEGGNATVFPYGIKSVSCKGETACRRICINTINNNVKRFNNYGYKKHETYLEFLASRYCPIGAKDDPTGLNKNWIKNVRFYYEK